MFKWVKPCLMAIGLSLFGGLIMVMVVYIYLLVNRPDLKVWHTADLDEEFVAQSDVTNFDEYLQLESRLFDQLESRVLDQIEAQDRYSINRFSRGSLSDPSIWPTNWNRTFTLETDDPRFGVLLLHGMSDSPYSLRDIGKRLNAEGGLIIGLRLPGHGVAPSGLLRLRLKDMDEATRLAMRHLRNQVKNGPLFIVGYSNGGALAVNYAVDAITDPALPEAERLILISPAIGVPRVTAFAVWQARLGRLLGLPKLEWNNIGIEYDPFKYVSFAVNAGDLVYQITNHLQAQIDSLSSADLLQKIPRILAFQSLVDATVSTPALIDGLFSRLPSAGHELVLFDIDRNEEVLPLLTTSHAADIAAVTGQDSLPFTISIVTNAGPNRSDVVLRRRIQGSDRYSEEALDLEWPEEIFSLSHVALPTSPSDPLYGRFEPTTRSHIYLGNITVRGEKGIFRIPAEEMARLSWNPFYEYLEERIVDAITTGEK